MLQVRRGERNIFYLNKRADGSLYTTSLEEPISARIDTIARVSGQEPYNPEKSLRLVASALWLGVTASMEGLLIPLSVLGILIFLIVRLVRARSRRIKRESGPT